MAQNEMKAKPAPPERVRSMEGLDRTRVADNAATGGSHDCGWTDTMVILSTLIEGVWFAMEQAGRLLGSAVRLYATDDFGSAIALAMFAHEELGRSRILLDVAAEVHGGGTIDVGALRRRCNDHLEKQRRGAFSVTFRGNHGDPLADALSQRMRSKPGSPEYEAAQARVDEKTAAIAEAQPSERHSERMGAVYLDIAADGKIWKRPAAIGRQAAYERVNDAVNDYSVGRQWFDDPLLNTSDEKLLAVNPKARLLRIRRPAGLVLPPPVWPQMPL